MFPLKKYGDTFREKMASGTIWICVKRVMINGSAVFRFQLKFSRSLSYYNRRIRYRICGVDSVPFFMSEHGIRLFISRMLCGNEERMLDVCLLGTGGMMPLPYRWLTSLMTRFNGSTLMIDCGEGTQIAVREKGWSCNPIDVICFTHFHGDHISGLPGLLLTMGNADRKEPLTLIGPKGLERVVKALRVIAPELPFPLKFVEIADPVQEFEIKGYHITAFRVNHNVTCYGYTIAIPRAGKFDPEKAKVLEIPLPFWSRLQKGETIETESAVFTPDMVMGPPRKGIKVTYVTDTRPTPMIVQQARNADLFICEGMYGERDKLQKAKEYKHMTFYEAAELAREADPKEMWLTHYSPSLTRPEEFMDDVRAIFPRAIAAKDGRTVELDFEDELATRGKG